MRASLHRATFGLNSWSEIKSDRITAPHLVLISSLWSQRITRFHTESIGTSTVFASCGLTPGSMNRVWSLINSTNQSEVADIFLLISLHGGTHWFVQQSGSRRSEGRSSEHSLDCLPLTIGNRHVGMWSVRTNKAAPARAGSLWSGAEWPSAAPDLRVWPQAGSLY